MLNINAIHETITKARRPKSIVILAYHRICALTGLFYDRNVSATPYEFKWQMKYMKENCNVISMKRVVDHYEGKTKLPKNSIAITFDDGFKDTAENAFPILKQHGLPAMLFVVTDFMKGDYVPWEDEMAYLINQIDVNNKLEDIRDMLNLSTGDISKDDLIFMICKSLRGLTYQRRRPALKKLYMIAGVSEQDVRQILVASKKGMMNDKNVIDWMSSGMEIGSHTCSHPQLSYIDNVEVEKELLFSKRNLEKINNTEISVLAYPYGMRGYYNKESIRLAQKTGYKCAVSLISGINTLRTDRFNLMRMPVARDLDFKSLCNGI